MTGTELRQRPALLHLVKAMRPKQWTKNVLVVAAPAAAGKLFVSEITVQVALTFLLFAIASSGTYLVNDAVDAPADRLHPVKRHRPVASGALSGKIAFAIGGAMLVAAPVAAFAFARPALSLLLVIYIVMTLSYSLGLKRVPVIELIILSAGFVLRAAAGGVAADVPLSDWFLLVTSFGALFVVAGKRHAELLVMDGGAEHRRVLQVYSVEFCRFVLTLSGAAVALTYCLWVLEIPQVDGMRWATLSVAPFLVAFLRYGLLVIAGEGGEPEELLSRDPVLLIAGVAWVAMLVLVFQGE